MPAKRIQIGEEDEQAKNHKAANKYKAFASKSIFLKCIVHIL